MAASSSSLSSAAGGTSTTSASLSPLSRRCRRTPVAARDCWGMASACIRTITPRSLTSNSSSPAPSTLRPTSPSPSRRNLRQRRPMPARFCSRNWSTGTRLPSPLALATNTQGPSLVTSSSPSSSSAPSPSPLRATRSASSAGSTSMLTKRSASRRFIARTPRAVRPRGRNSSSLRRKWIVMPLREPISTLSPGRAWRTQRRSSPSSREMAIKPLERMLLKADKRVRLM